MGRLETDCLNLLTLPMIILEAHGLTRGALYGTHDALSIVDVICHDSHVFYTLWTFDAEEKCADMSQTLGRYQLHYLGTQAGFDDLVRATQTQIYQCANVIREVEGKSQ